MKHGVVIVTPYFYPVIGGVESNAERLARYLVAAGVRVQVVTKRIGRTLADSDDRDGVSIQRIGPYGERSSLGKWQVAPAVLRWLVRHAADYDVICCVDYRAVGVAALAARALTRRPVVCQAQTTGVLSGENADQMLQAIGIAPDGWLGRAVKRPIRALYGRADTIACISHQIEGEALACGVPRARVRYFPNAIDMTQFRPAHPGERDALRRQRDLPTDRVICLFVGRLSREKGLLDLLEGWRRLAPAGALLLIAGPDMTGHARDAGVSGRAFVERHRLVDSVRFLGPITDVASLLRAVDLMIQPSHFEALGLSAIEALASGVPVAASAVGGLLEFIVEDDNGRLFPAHDPERLAACVGGLLADSAARGRLAARARASVHDEFDEQIVFGRMRELFEQLASGQPPTSLPPPFQSVRWSFDFVLRSRFAFHRYPPTARLWLSAAAIALKAGVTTGIIVLSEKLRQKNRVAAFVMMATMNSAYAIVASHNYALAH
jgi:glycosyltransferase involved in cell wall biosynthesis